MEWYIFFCDIQDNNEILFFWLIVDYIEEMMLIIYMLMVGEVCECFFDIYCSVRGLFIVYY